MTDSRVTTRAKCATPLLLALVAICSYTPAALAQAKGQRSPVAPTREQVQAVVDDAYAQFKTNTQGKNADYIPALAQVDPKLFGIVVVSTDNQIASAGNIDHAFSIQSISKVFSLALAMEELGADAVFAKIGNEAT